MEELRKRYRPSECIDFQRHVLGPLALAIEAAFADLDRIHVLPKLVHLSLVSNRKRSEQGSYDPRGPVIAVSAHAANPIATIVHEFGHFLDNRMLHPISREYASRYASELKELLTLCLLSRPYQLASRILRTRRVQLARSDIAYLRDSMQPQELFARAYVQWVHSRSSDEQVRNALNHRIEEVLHFAGFPYRLHWDSSEFADIMEAMERLFSSGGLL